MPPKWGRGGIRNEWRNVEWTLSDRVTQLEQAPCQEFVTDKIAKFICKGMQPIGTISVEEFWDFMTELEPQYKIQSRTTSSTHAVQLNDTTRENIKTYENKTKLHVISNSFDLDFWKKWQPCRGFPSISSSGCRHIPSYETFAEPGSSHEDEHGCFSTEPATRMLCLKSFSFDTKTHTSNKLKRIKALWCSSTAAQIVRETTNCYVRSHLLWSKIRLHYLLTLLFSPHCFLMWGWNFFGIGLSLCCVLNEFDKYSEKQTPIVSLNMTLTLDDS